MKKITLNAAYGLLLLLTAYLCCGIPYNTAIAEQIDYDALLENYTDKYIQSDNENNATKSSKGYGASKRYMYEEATVKNLSHLYWAVNLYKFEDDKAIDEFMRLNECEIYKNYSTDELEWSEIRNASRDFLRDNKRDFPTRFEFTIPLKLEDYEKKRQAFQIQDEFKIDSLRRFEVYAIDFHQHRPCTEDHKIDKGYPRVLVLEFSRPFSLTYVPMSQDMATDYTRRKMEPVNIRYAGSRRTRARILTYRDAYVILKVKIFTHGKFLAKTGYDANSVQMMGVLEGFEIYEDKNKERLLYEQNYVTSQGKGKLDEHLKAQYELLRRKHKGGGLFH